MKVTSTIVKNKQDDKPNEDYILVDNENQLFIVIDGVSRDRIHGIYPNPSPSAYIANLFAEFIKENYDNNKPLHLLFEQGNNFIQKCNAGHDDYFKPGVVAIGVRLIENILEWVSIGDCIGLLIRDNNALKFNTKQTQKLRESVLKFESKFIRTEICNNPNHPLGYGVLDGNPNAKIFFEFGCIELLKADNICLLTDGLEMLIDNNLELKLISLNIDEIINLAESIEVTHKIRTDDKSFIRIEI